MLKCRKTEVILPLFIKNCLTEIQFTFTDCNVSNKYNTHVHISPCWLFNLKQRNLRNGTIISPDHMFFLFTQPVMTINTSYGWPRDALAIVNGMSLVRELEHGVDVVDGQLLRPADNTEGVHEAAVAAMLLCNHQEARIPLAQIVW